MKLTANLLFFILSAALSVSGCSSLGVGKSDFGCKGGAEGVHCLSAREVYQATEASDVVKPKTSEDDDGDTKPKIVRQQTGQVAVPKIGQPVPIRTQAQVMRIWMAPWEDDDGDLHADGYLYTEIEGRRWALGDRFTAPQGTLRPLGR